MNDDTPTNFTRSSADLIGRTIKDFRGMGRGQQPLPKRRRMVPGAGGGGGGSSELSVCKATADIPHATDSGGTRTPGSSSSYTHIDGPSVTGDLKNWSGVNVTEDSYMFVDSANKIVSAFC